MGWWWNLVDTADLKFAGRKAVRVRVPAIPIFVLVLSACVAGGVAQSQPTLRANAIFRSHATGSLAVQEIFGDSSAFWAKAPKHLTLVFGDPSKAKFLLTLVRAHTVLPTATIDDPSDGEYYTLKNLEAIGYRNDPVGSPPQSFPAVTFKVGKFHLKCGPPTCSTPEQIYYSAPLSPAV